MLNYTFTAVHFAFAHPLAGTFVSTGENALGGITVTNTTEHTRQSTTVDGAVIVNFIPGDSGAVQIQCSQVSSLHKYLVQWHNLVKSLAAGGDQSNYANATIVVRDLNTLALHTVQGVSPNKIPDKQYGAEAQMVTWNLPAAKVISE